MTSSEISEELHELAVKIVLNDHSNDKSESSYRIRKIIKLAGGRDKAYALIRHARQTISMVA